MPSPHPSSASSFTFYLLYFNLLAFRDIYPTFLIQLSYFSVYLPWRWKQHIRSKPIVTTCQDIKCHDVKDHVYNVGAKPHGSVQVRQSLKGTCDTHLEGGRFSENKEIATNQICFPPPSSWYLLRFSSSLKISQILFYETSVKSNRRSQRYKPLREPQNQQVTWRSY